MRQRAGRVFKALTPAARFLWLIAGLQALGMIVRLLADIA
jgi:hypothetical protein